MRSLIQMAVPTVFCYGFLIVSLTHATTSQTTVCNNTLIIPQSQQTQDSQTMGGNGNINNRSLSAWKWITHTSAHRIPRVLYEAECVSHHCTHPKGHELNSVPIYSNMLVLTQDPKNRTCYNVNFQTLAVGCQCVWHKSSESTSTK